MSLESPNQENIAFHYVVRDSQVLERIHPEIFQNIYVKAAIKLCKEFHGEYGKLPFNPTKPDTKQIIEYANDNKIIKHIDVKKETSENYTNFKKNIEHILSYQYDKFDSDYVDKASKAFIKWNHFLINLEGVNDFVAGIVPDLTNIDTTIDKAIAEFMSNASFDFNKEQAINFWDADSHKPPEDGVFVPTTYEGLNKMLGGKGFEKGTLTHFWGAPNAGKTIVLGNVALSMCLTGQNVYYASLEMKSEKLVKRIGANIFNVSMSDYESFGSDIALVNEKMKNFHGIRTAQRDSGQVPVGELYFYRFTDATPLSVFAHANKLGMEKGITWDAIVVDYLGELKSDNDNMYSGHKDNNGKLFDLSVNNNVAGITAHQIAPPYYDIDDYGMDAVAEGRGVNHRTDQIFGIIQTPEMHSNKIYFIKNIKARDNGLKGYRMKYNIDYDHMKLTETGVWVAPNEFIPTS